MADDPLSCCSDCCSLSVGKRRDSRNINVGKDGMDEGEPSVSTVGAADGRINTGDRDGFLVGDCDAAECLVAKGVNDTCEFVALALDCEPSTGVSDSHTVGAAEDNGLCVASGAMVGKRKTFALGFIDPVSKEKN